ncbi:MFS transporter [Rhodococcus rhodochrous]|uniref:MFS transporter n=1 Tax=Rhodococcus rhodochrous TaxID=1829 RepID=UPI001E5FA171|nr:MFS transporter [Rhodococcus rhodochrous]MCB8914035.1 MFS transporter [Rhodococcus rhodochrous]
MSIRDSIDDAPMSRYQVMVVGICLAIVLSEGYDLLLMAFAAPDAAQEWGLSGSQTGLLLSSALVGMALGSAFIAPLADRTGRRPLTLCCLLLVTVTMALAALTTNVAQLGACRLLTGVGIGGLVASLPVLTAEFSPRRRRGTMIALYTTGLPLGGVIGGLVAALLTSTFSWRASFVAGAILTFLLLVLVYARMPESIDYLLVRRPAGALEKINATLPKMGLPPIDALPDPEPQAEQGMKAAIFTGRNGIRSLLLGSAFFIMMAAFYFAASWTPKLLQESGMSAQQGISGGMLLNLGGAAATLTFSVLAIVATSRTLTIAALIGASVSFLGMSAALGSLGTALIAAVAVGVFVNASATGLYALTPDCYPASVRATAVGWASAVGRLGAIISPILAGILIDRSWTPSSLFVLFAIPLLIGALLVAAIKMPTQERAPALSPSPEGAQA